jgi:hypothetical protein
MYGESLTLFPQMLVLSLLTIRTLMHDPNAFVDPLKYEPERYLNLKNANERLDDTVRSPGAAAFGFGRR